MLRDHSARRGRDATQWLSVLFIHAVGLDHGFGNVHVDTFTRLSIHAVLEAFELKHQSAVLLVYRWTRSLL